MDTLHTVAARWGFELSQAQLEQFTHYAHLLTTANQQLNLTRITDPHAMIVRHFLDSLVCARYWGAVPQRLADIGSGAGFPGIPLKILHPTLKLTLVESIGKKAAFLRNTAAALGLHDVTVLDERAEAIGQLIAHREQYDVVTARAVAELRVLVEYCLPLCRIGGRMLAPKGAAPEVEVTAASDAIALLGGAPARIVPIELADDVVRTLVVIEKHASTPAHLPRKVGLPARRPL
ncbi:MAG TPA: 16S rRNA (guanine(527)-N(7))-methyltransferase RsmG [Roseiflexaceae bacterium]|nr:16S rRNA (guanine(527)-N(7))-methyltransferase RsmG [Roseiflexaceae bacterium]HMP39328.1 16S rRNA (guanine(527)-N(7))-methyltransferase RsmG [Roseiflexaceae bacterium]